MSFSLISFRKLSIFYTAYSRKTFYFLTQHIPGSTAILGGDGGNVPAAGHPSPWSGGCRFFMLLNIYKAKICNKIWVYAN